MTTKRISVTVARLPEEAITELDERIGKLWREENIDHDNDELISDDIMTTFNLLTIGYDAAWTEVERLSEALAGVQKERNEVLAALEESQQRIGKLELYVKSLEFNRDYTQKSANEKLRERGTELVEAQQTIAKHEEALNGIIAYSTDKNAVDIASESMGYPEGENEEEKCRYCTGRPLVDREPLMKSQLSDYNVFINSVNYLEDSIIGGSAPHSLYGVKIKYCPVCGKELGNS